jgi:hypothetical protein
MSKEQKSNKKPSKPLLTKEDGQFEKLEGKKKSKKIIKSLFSKDVNDPSERGHD